MSTGAHLEMTRIASPLNWQYEEIEDASITKETSSIIIWVTAVQEIALEVITIDQTDWQTNAVQLMERNPAFIEVVYLFDDVTITCGDSAMEINPVSISFNPPTASCTSTPASKVFLTGPITNQATG